MKTPFDLLSLILFAGLAILYLQRSADERPDSTPLWRYAVVAAGCAASDVAGNHDLPWVGYAGLAATAIAALLMLKPFVRQP